MSDEIKDAKDTSGALLDKDEPIQEPVLDPSEEADPELQELRAKIKAEKERARHARMDTGDIEARITKQIAEAVIQKLKDEQTLYPPPTETKSRNSKDLDDDQGKNKETKETDMTSSVIATEEPCDNSVEDSWLQHVKDAELSVKAGKEPETEGVGLEEDQFSRRAIGKASSFVAHTVPKCPVTYQSKMIRTPIYDLLLEKYNFHKALVHEYDLRHALAEHEKFTKDRNSPKFATSALACIQIYFSLAEYDKADLLVQDLLKKSPKSAEALYWQGLVAFYTYRRAGNKDSVKKALAIKAETVLLQVAMLRAQEKKDSTDVMIFWVLLVLTLELKNIYTHLKVKVRNVPEVYSSEIKKIDDYLGYVAWTEIYRYSKVQSQMNDAKDLLWELIGKNTNRPEAYCKLWSIYSKEGKMDKCLDICERLFLDGTEFDDDTYITIIVLLNAKSAMMGRHYLLAYQKLQYQYVLNTSQPILLYYYGKYICECDNELIRRHFQGSAISALQECLRSCHESRHGKVFYWLGKLHSLRGDTIHALEYYDKIVSQSLLPKTSPKRREVDAFIKNVQTYNASLRLVSETIRAAYQKAKGIQPAAAQHTKPVDLRNAFKVLEANNPNYKRYLWIMYCFYVEGKRETVEADIIDYVSRAPIIMESYIDLWGIAAGLKKQKLMVMISDTLAKMTEMEDPPNDLWIKANIIRAKNLIRVADPPKYEEARSILQQLTQILPPLPLPETNEYSALDFRHKSSSIAKSATLDFASSSEEPQPAGPTLHVSILEVEDQPKPETASESDQKQTNVGTTEISSAKASPEPKPKHEKRSSAFEIQRAVLVDVGKHGEGHGNGRLRSSRPSIALQSSPRPEAGAESGLAAEDSKEGEVKYGNEMFSISTECSYLYLLGKIAIKYGTDAKEGVDVLCDCVEIMRLLGFEGCKMFLKAKYWIAYALLSAGHKPQANKLLREIQPQTAKVAPGLAGKVADMIKECEKPQ